MLRNVLISFFRAVEDVIRNNLKMLAHPIPPSKLQMIQNITNDEDLLGLCKC